MATAQSTPGNAGQSNKARPFFDRARTLGEIGSFDQAIDLYIQGLAFAPDDIEAHKALRDVALLRKAGGGKPMGFLEKRKLPKPADGKQAMLIAEKLLAYDPGNTEHMAAIARAANAAGFAAIAQWMEGVLRQAT